MLYTHRPYWNYTFFMKIITISSYYYKRDIIEKKKNHLRAYITIVFVCVVCHWLQQHAMSQTTTLIAVTSEVRPSSDFGSEKDVVRVILLLCLQGDRTKFKRGCGTAAAVLQVVRVPIYPAILLLYIYVRSKNNI